MGRAPPPPTALAALGRGGASRPPASELGPQHQADGAQQQQDDAPHDLQGERGGQAMPGAGGSGQGRAPGQLLRRLPAQPPSPAACLRSHRCAPPAARQPLHPPACSAGCGGSWSAGFGATARCGCPPCAACRASAGSSRAAAAGPTGSARPAPAAANNHADKGAKVGTHAKPRPRRGPGSAPAAARAPAACVPAACRTGCAALLPSARRHLPRVHHHRRHHWLMRLAALSASAVCRCAAAACWRACCICSRCRCRSARMAAPVACPTAAGVGDALLGAAAAQRVASLLMCLGWPWLHRLLLWAKKLATLQSGSAQHPCQHPPQCGSHPSARPTPAHLRLVQLLPPLLNALSRLVQPVGGGQQAVALPRRRLRARSEEQADSWVLGCWARGASPALPCHSCWEATHC